MKSDKDRALRDELDDLAGAEARGEVEGPVLHALRRPRSQVYSLRLPVEQADRLQELADAADTTPGALIRYWVTERLGVSDVSTITLSGAQAIETFERKLAEVLEAAISRATSALTVCTGTRSGTAFASPP